MRARLGVDGLEGECPLDRLSMNGDDRPEGAGETSSDIGGGVTERCEPFETEVASCWLLPEVVLGDGVRLCDVKIQCRSQNYLE